jgi:KaiC/GvpD/RAD55 family RecA-like ATPase
VQNALMPLSDNLVALRLEVRGNRLIPLLTVIKTGGSRHDWRTHRCSLGHGGLRVGKPMSGGEFGIPEAA